VTLKSVTVGECMAPSGRAIWATSRQHACGRPRGAAMRGAGPSRGETMGGARYRRQREVQVAHGASGCAVSGVAAHEAPQKSGAHER